MSARYRRAPVQNTMLETMQASELDTVPTVTSAVFASVAISSWLVQRTLPVLVCLS